MVNGTVEEVPSKRTLKAGTVEQNTVKEGTAVYRRRMLAWLLDGCGAVALQLPAASGPAMQAGPC